MSAGVDEAPTFLFSWAFVVFGGMVVMKCG
jgi:hypothetical protein